jgi:phosphoglycerate dehydrogenase-like enzyme
MKTVWTNVGLSDQEDTWLRQQIQPYELIRDLSVVNNLSEGKGDPEAQKAEILFGQPAVTDILSSESAKWIHLTSAGYTRYDTETIKQRLSSHSILFSNSSSVYDVPCAEHVLSMILAHNRLILESERARQWTYDDQRPRMRVLKGQNVLIVGYGAIARKLTEFLRPFGCEIRGLKRKVSGQELVQCEPIENHLQFLPWADHVVNILPLNDSTKLFFGAKQFAAMRPGAAFYNIGRGDTVDQDALIGALEGGQLSAAYLDVVSPEPLVQEHPLWRTKNCLITPHVAGGLQAESQTLLDHFMENFRRFNAGESLLDLR